MLLLTKSISQLILPPGGLILGILLGLIFCRKTWGKSLLVLSISLFWLLSTEPIRDMLTGSLEYQYPALNIEQLDVDSAAIVVLGGGMQENALDYQGRDELSRFAMMRAIYAAKIAEKNSFDLYPTGGAPLTEGAEAEGDIMKRWLIWFGVEEARLHAENRAVNTWQNATLIQKELAKQQINTVILVTSAYHMPRSVWCFEQQGLKIIPAPTDYLTEQGLYDLRSYLPSHFAFVDSSRALHEYLGLLWYKIKYP